MCSCVIVVRRRRVAGVWHITGTTATRVRVRLVRRTLTESPQPLQYLLQLHLLIDERPLYLLELPLLRREPCLGVLERPFGLFEFLSLLQRLLRLCTL